MPTSLLYHGFGVKGYRYLRSDYHEGNIIFTITRKKFSIRCPVCESKNIIRHGSLPRWFHSLPIGKKPTYIKTEIPRFECKECKTIRQAHLGFRIKKYGPGYGSSKSFHNQADRFLWRIKFAAT